VRNGVTNPESINQTKSRSQNRQSLRLYNLSSTHMLGTPMIDSDFSDILSTTERISIIAKSTGNGRDPFRCFIPIEHT
jgi:hypothetical protein